MTIQIREDGQFCGHLTKLKTIPSQIKLTVEISTNNRFILQPSLVLFHGSSGITSEIIQWKERGLQEGYTVYVIDFFSGRDIEKLSLDGTDKAMPSPISLMKDFHSLLASEIIKNKKDISLVGFSIGATAAMLSHQVDFKKTYAFYPTLRPAFELLLSVPFQNLKIITGELDQITPSKDLIYLNNIRNEKIDHEIIPFTYHTFMRKGVDAHVRAKPLGINYEFDNKLVDNKTYEKIYSEGDLFKFESTERVRLKENKNAIEKYLNEFFAI